MSFWHETRKPKAKGGCTSSQKKEGLYSCIRYPDSNQNETKFSIYAQLWVGEGDPELRFTQGWVELWPKTPIVASDFQEARRLQLEYLAQLETYIDEQLYNKVYSLTAFVEAVEHSSKKFLARIYHREDEKFEIEYSKWSESRGGELWVTTRRSFGTLTVVDNLESAREAARLELDEFAAGVYT